MKTTKELRKLATAELEKELKSCMETMLKLRFQKVVDDVTDTTPIRKNRRQIARIKTLLREQEIQNSRTQAK